MRHWLLCFWCLGSFVLSAQLDSIDTVELTGVEVTADRYQRFGAGTRVTEYNLTDRPDLSGYSLADQLRALGAITIKGYGPSGLNTLSVRGAGASQTAVVWQGFNLQSTMNGQHDLALLPAFFLDEVALQHGPASSLYGSGTAGGALHVGSTPRFDEEVGVRALVSGGSFGHRMGGLQINASDEHYASDTRVYGQNQENDFPYTNIARSGMPEETLSNSGLNQWGIQRQDRFLIGEKHRLEFGLLRMETRREIPPTMLQGDRTTSQDDQNLRAYLDWVYCAEGWSAHLKTSWLYEEIIYREPASGLEAYNDANTWVAMPSVQVYPGSNHLLELGGQWLYSKAVADGYPEGHSLTEPALFAAYRWTLKKVPLTVNASARQPWRDDQRLPLVPTFGFAYRLSKVFRVQGQVARAYRMPTLNDLYWEPGGNPDLRAEHGWSQEMGLQWTKPARGDWTVEAGLTGFHQRLQDQIIWVPGPSLWSPQNVGLVRTVGVEGQTAVTFQRGDWRGEAELAVQWAKARDITQGEPKPLIYTPDWKCIGTFKVAWRNITVVYSHQWTSRRLVNLSSGFWLAPFHVGDLSANGRFLIGPHRFQAFASIRNITNSTYQTVARRPMPGIHGVVGIQYHFSKPKNTEE